VAIFWLHQQQQLLLHQPCTSQAPAKSKDVDMKLASMATNVTHGLELNQGTAKYLGQTVVPHRSM
jgi:hypothetical protein